MYPRAFTNHPPKIFWENPGKIPGNFPRCPGRCLGVYHKDVSREMLGFTPRIPQRFLWEFPTKARKICLNSRGVPTPGIPGEIIGNPQGIWPKTNAGMESWELPPRICPGRCSGVLLGFPKDYPGKSRQKPGKFAWIPGDCPGRCSGVPPGVSQGSPKDFPRNAR